MCLHCEGKRSNLMNCIAISQTGKSEKLIKHIVTLELVKDFSDTQGKE